MKDNVFLVSWDQMGLEALIPIESEKYEQEILDILADNEDKLNYSTSIRQTINMLLLRAQTNNHRYYEIYTFGTKHSINEAEIRRLFKKEPQMMVDLIREKGAKIYSNRINPDQIIIR